MTPAAHPPRPGRPPRLALLLGLLATVGPFTIDTFFPSLRAIANAYGVTYLQAQQTLTAYMVPYAIMSLVHGSLSDALGRRRVILVGLGPIRWRRSVARWRRISGCCSASGRCRASSAARATSSAARSSAIASAACRRSG